MSSELSPRLKIIGSEWKSRSRELADWGMERLVNRKDVWGQYTGKAGAGKALTLPQKTMRGKDMVTLDKLTRHFGSNRRNHLIGLHAASPDEMCRWLAIDIDQHAPDSIEAEDTARRNFAAARAWWGMLQGRGYDPILLDSNGQGGFHIWILFREPAPMADVHAFGQSIVTEWEAKNLDEQPETFPKSPKLSDDKMGAWLRLPGLHHTHDHFTKVWSGDEWLDDPWLEGNEAISELIRNVPGPPPKAGAALRGKSKKKKATGRKRPKFESRKKRARVCVDLDGVLAAYDGWQGVEQFGDPLPGAIEFTRDLAKWADVIIFTSRCHVNDQTHSAAERKGLVKAWLDENGFTYSDIFAGQGKPMADAYIDDRAVSCRPQDDGPVAFETAASLAKSLANR